MKSMIHNATVVDSKQTRNKETLHCFSVQ